MNPLEREKKSRSRPKPVRIYRPTADEPAPEHRMCLTCDYRYLGLKCPQCASLSYVTVVSRLAP